MDINDLWVEYKRTGDIENRNQLILEYLPIVRKIANMQLYNSANYDLREEFYSIGLMGLIDAVQKFDYRKNVKFETYASFRIKGAIKDFMRKQDWLPRGLRDKQRVIEQTRETLTKRLMREPTDREIIVEANLTDDEYNDAMRKIAYADIASFEDALSKGMTTKRANPENDVETIVEKKELESLLTQAIGELSEREQLVISLYYREELKLKEIGQILKISESRVSQLMKTTIIKLRKSINDYI